MLLLDDLATPHESSTAYFGAACYWKNQSLIKSGWKSIFFMLYQYNYFVQELVKYRRLA